MLTRQMRLIIWLSDFDNRLRNERGQLGRYKSPTSALPTIRVVITEYGAEFIWAGTPLYHRPARDNAGVVKHTDPQIGRYYRLEHNLSGTVGGNDQLLG